MTPKHTPKQKLERDIGRLADALSVSPMSITAAIWDCDKECTKNPGARKELHIKLDHELDRLARVSGRISNE